MAKFFVPQMQTQTYNPVFITSDTVHPERGSWLSVVLAVIETSALVITSAWVIRLVSPLLMILVGGVAGASVS